MADTNFQQDLRIDKFALDDVCVGHADLVAKWGLLWADAVYERDRLEGELELVRGQCDQEIRERPSKFGWQKADKAPSEAFIKAAIYTHINYVSTNEAYQTAQHEVNILVVAKNAFEHRDKRLSDLARLYGSGYYSSNMKLDQGYKDLVARQSTEAQVESLSQNPRITLRKKLQGD